MRSNTEKNEQKIKNQEEEIQRKLNQLQLEELTKRNKKIIQAPIKKEEYEKKQLQSLQMHTTFLYPLLMYILNIQSKWDGKNSTKRTERKRQAYTGPPGMCWGFG